MISVKKKIKVLIVDDSIVFREMLAREITRDNSIEVVATANDPYMARDKILEFEPDVMTLDVEMPRMSGIEFLKRLMPQYPLPVVMVSSVSENVFDALNAGAVDFVTKPNIKDGNSLMTLIRELIVKIKIASTAKVGLSCSRSESSPVRDKGKGLLRRNCIVAVGASTGGTEAIDKVLRDFPADMPGTVIVQHMPPVFTKLYANRLNAFCKVEVKEAETGDMVLPGKVLIAPGNYHMKIKYTNKGYMVECFQGDKVNGHCPAVDVLFHSVAEQAGHNAVGVLLTGMGADGAKGLLALRRAGANTIGQDAASSVVYGMPKAAYELGAVQEQLSLEKISGKLYSLVHGRS